MKRKADLLPDTKDTASPTTLTPQALAISYTWSQFYTPVNLGTVYVIINNLNQTKTVTSTNSSALTAARTQFLNNGTLQLLTRTDVDSAGTVTAPVPTGLNETSTMSVYSENMLTNTS
jgi:hypothetical protein